MDKFGQMNETRYYCREHMLSSTIIMQFVIWLHIVTNVLYFISAGLCILSNNNVVYFITLAIINPIKCVHVIAAHTIIDMWKLILLQHTHNNVVMLSKLAVV